MVKINKEDLPTSINATSFHLVFTPDTTCIPDISGKGVKIKEIESRDRIIQSKSLLNLNQIMS